MVSRHQIVDSYFLTEVNIYFQNMIKNSVVVGDTGKAKHVVTDMIFVKSFTENLESRSREDAKMRSCGEGFRKSGEPKIRRSEDVKLRGGFQKIWRAEDPKIRRCEAAERVSENLEGRRQIQLIIQRNMLYKNAHKISAHTVPRRSEDPKMQDQSNVHPALQYWENLADMYISDNRQLKYNQ